MQDNRNCQQNSALDSRRTVCIDTTLVLDSCKDRDCFENSRVYLTAYGEELLKNATNVRTKSAETVWAYVGVEEVPFNCGFYRVSVRYYIVLDFEVCLGINRSQTFTGLAVLEKDVVLYGGEGNITSYSSDPNAGYCSFGNTDSVRSNLPIAVVESVEPVVLGTKVVECECNSCSCCDCFDLPDCVKSCLGGDICNNDNTPKLYVSFGIFSVIRIERPTQLLIQAVEYSVPDKECCAATNSDNPCDIFRNIAFPTSRFQISQRNHDNDGRGRSSGSCGCNK